MGIRACITPLLNSLILTFRYHTPVTSPKQEKWHRSHKVILDRYHRSLINQVQNQLVLMEMHFADLLAGEFCPQCFYIAQHKTHLSISFSLEFTSQSIAIMEANERSMRGVLQELVPALNTNTYEK